MTGLPPSAADTRRDRVRLALLAAGAAAVVLAVHWPALRARAVIFDDYFYFIQNPLVTNPGWNSVATFFREVTHPSTVKGYYQPLSMTSLMIDYALGGRAENLVPFHRTSLALHVANTVLLIVLLVQLFGRPGPAAAVGLLFGLHPLNVEAIPWVAERKTLLAAFFSLGSMIAYVRYARGRRTEWFAAALALYVLALLSKPTSVPLPVLLLLLDWWPLGRLRRRAVVEKWPFGAVGAFFAIITLVSQANAAGAQSPGERGTLHVLLIVGYNVTHYLRSFLWPSNLSVYYPVPDFAQSLRTVVITQSVTILVAVVAWLSTFWTRAIAASLLFFFVAILPTLGVVGFTHTVAADRFMYLPMIGLLLPVAALARTAERHRFRPLVLGGIAVACAAGGAATRQYLRHWQDAETLYTRAVRLAPQAPILRNSLSNVLLAAGKFDEAIANYHAGLAHQPDSALLRNGLGRVLELRGRMDDAVAQYALAARLAPRSAEYACNHANALRQAGRMPEALIRCEEAVRRDPRYVPARILLGTMLIESRRYAEAAPHFQAALDVDPTNETAREGLAIARAGAPR